jgi:hypothetical protein
MVEAIRYVPRRPCSVGLGDRMDNQHGSSFVKLLLARRRWGVVLHMLSLPCVVTSIPSRCSAESLNNRAKYAPLARSLEMGRVVSLPLGRSVPFRHPVSRTSHWRSFREHRYLPVSVGSKSSFWHHPTNPLEMIE